MTPGIGAAVVGRMASVAVFDGGCGEGREGGGCAGWGAAVFGGFKSGLAKLSSTGDHEIWEKRGEIHGISDGVSGFEDGCGRLMKVG